MKMKSVLPKPLCIFGMIVVFAFACTFNVNAEPAQPEPVKLKVVALPFLSFSPFFIAEEEGYFAQQGIEVEFVKMESMAQTIPLLLQGQIDVTSGSVNSGLFNAIARNGDLRIVADKGYIASTGCTYAAFITRSNLLANNALNRPEQVRTLKFSTAISRTPGYYTAQLLKPLGVKLQDVIIMDVPDANLADALQSGAIDIAWSGEPWVSLLLKNPNLVVWKGVEEIKPDFQLGVMLYGSKLLVAKPEIGIRFMIAYLKGVQQYNQGKTARNIEILMKQTGLDREIVQGTCWPSIRDQGEIHHASILDFQQWAVEQGLLDQIVLPERYWDRRFIESANQKIQELSE